MHHLVDEKLDINQDMYESAHNTDARLDSLALFSHLSTRKIPPLLNPRDRIRPAFLCGSSGNNRGGWLAPLVRFVRLVVQGMPFFSPTSAAAPDPDQCPRCPYFYS